MQHEYILSFSDWEMVTEQKECDGSKIKKGGFSNIRACAEECRGLASMFIFERNSRCEEGLCQCYCETTAKHNGTCRTDFVNDYNLYKYKGNYALQGVIKTSIRQYNG